MDDFISVCVLGSRLADESPKRMV